MPQEPLRTRSSDWEFEEAHKNGGLFVRLTDKKEEESATAIDEKVFG